MGIAYLSPLYGNSRMSFDASIKLDHKQTNKKKVNFRSSPCHQKHHIIIYYYGVLSKVYDVIEKEKLIN